MPQTIDGFLIDPETEDTEQYYRQANRFMAHYDGPLDVVVDMGAHYGSLSLLAARKGARLVYAYEPNQLAYQYLVLNIMQNGFWGRIIPMPFAVAAKGGQHRQFWHIWEGNTGAAGLYIPGGEPGPVLTMGFVDIIESLGRIDYLKVDVEGAEFEILAKTSLVAAALKRVRYLDLEIHELCREADLSHIATYTHSGLMKNELREWIRECDFRNSLPKEVAEEHGENLVGSYNENFKP
jgi:FkbM family methyltransferase